MAEKRLFVRTRQALLASPNVTTLWESQRHTTPESRKSEKHRRERTMKGCVGICEYLCVYEGMCGVHAVEYVLHNVHGSGFLG
jgi:hypothetical protein